MVRLDGRSGPALGQPAGPDAGRPSGWASSSPTQTAYWTLSRGPDSPGSADPASTGLPGQGIAFRDLALRARPGAPNSGFAGAEFRGGVCLWNSYQRGCSH